MCKERSCVILGVEVVVTLCISAIYSVIVAFLLEGWKHLRFHSHNVILIIIIIFLNCSWVVTQWQWLFYMYTNMKIKVTRKFKLGGLHERHVVATWKLGNHLSIRL